MIVEKGRKTMSIEQNPPPSLGDDWDTEPLAQARGLSWLEARKEATNSYQILILALILRSAELD